MTDCKHGDVTLWGIGGIKILPLSIFFIFGILKYHWNKKKLLLASIVKWGIFFKHKGLHYHLCFTVLAYFFTCFEFVITCENVLACIMWVIQVAIYKLIKNTSCATKIYKYFECYISHFNQDFLSFLF